MVDIIDKSIISLITTHIKLETNNIQVTMNEI